MSPSQLAVKYSYYYEDVSLSRGSGPAGERLLWTGVQIHSTTKTPTIPLPLETDGRDRWGFLGTSLAVSSLRGGYDRTRPLLSVFTSGEIWGQFQ